MTMPKGFKHSEETKNKIKEKRKFQVFSEETKKKLSEKRKLRVGDKAPNWRGGKIHMDGYIYIFNPNHPKSTKKGYVCEHRLVMEKHLGRYLTNEEVIHHIDGSRDNNDIKNLVLCTKVNFYKNMVKLNLASGNDYRRGWINIDNGSMMETGRLVDIKANIFEYDRENDSVDDILLSHFAMYVRPDEMEVLLKRWYNWLKIGGKIEIETINFRIVTELIDDTEMGLVNIFGTKETCPHRWGWTIEALTKEMEKAGFIDITYFKGDKKPNRDYKLIATK